MRVIAALSLAFLLAAHGSQAATAQGNRAESDTALKSIVVDKDKDVHDIFDRYIRYRTIGSADGFASLRAECADGTKADELRRLTAKGDVLPTIGRLCRMALEHSASVELNPATSPYILADEGILAPYTNMLGTLKLPVNDVNALRLIGKTNTTVEENRVAKNPITDPLKVTFTTLGTSYDIYSGTSADSAFSAVIEDYKKTHQLPAKPTRTRAQIESALDTSHCFHTPVPGEKPTAVCAAAGHDLAALDVNEHPIKAALPTGVRSMLSKPIRYLSAQGPQAATAQDTRAAYDAALKCFVANGNAEAERRDAHDAAGAARYDATGKQSFDAAMKLGRMLGLANRQLNHDLDAIQAAELPRMVKDRVYFINAVAVCKGLGLM